MRLIFFLILVVNLAFFAWRTYYVEPPPQASIEVPAVSGDQVNRLLLLTEFDESALRQRVSSPTTEASLNASTSADGNGQTICYSVGPVSGDQQITLISSWLKDKGAPGTLRESERREVSRFWVYFPPFDSRSAAVERVSKMKSDEIDDIYVIPAGDMANAVSLGLYSHKESLDRRLTELRDKGYEPSTVPRYETQVASWFEVQLDADVPFPEAQFAAAFPDTETTQRGCG